MLALLICVGSIATVNAETPTYDENFDTLSDMMTALGKYEEQYPYYEGCICNRYVGADEHLEYRQIINVGISNSDVQPAEYSFTESNYGNGVDITATTFYNADKSQKVMSMVHYGYDSAEIVATLFYAKSKEGVSSFDEGVIDNKNYLICYFDAEYTDYYLVEGEYLIWFRTFMETDNSFLKNITIEYLDAYIPVKVSDSTEWFDKTIENGYVIGDSNSDGELNIRDATALQKYCAKMGKVDKLVADFNGDLKINVRDATDIQKKLAGLKYTCRRELYPVTSIYINFDEAVVLEATTDYAGPFSTGELNLITNADGENLNYANVFNTVEEFEAFFGKTLDRYNEEFFENNALVYVYRSHFSSSHTWTPERVTFANGVLYVYCHYNAPEKLEFCLSSNNLYYEVKKEDIKGLKGICINELVKVKL